MVRVNPQKLAEELKKQNKVYGDGEDQLGGSAPDPDVDDDVEESLEGVIGNQPYPGSFSLSDEVDEDETARRSKPLEPSGQEE